MRHFTWVAVIIPFAAIPGVAIQKPLVPQLELPQPLQRGLPPNVEATYKAPKPDGPVVELLDEGVEALFPLLINDGGGEAGTIVREDRDVFAGVEAVRVTPLQKYRSRIPGWDFKIVEKPTRPGEFRYLRFAWKKQGGPGIMIQFHDPVKSWGIRYFAGQNAVGWQPALSVSGQIPEKWQLVTRDLFKDHGAFTMTGVAFTAMYGEPAHALFDHMLLGRTIADLDKSTDLALGRTKPAKPLEGKERDRLWDDLRGLDRPRATTAIRAFLATAPEQVEFIRDKIAVPNPDKERAAQIRQLAADLDDDEFETREKATDALVKIGAPAIETLRTLAANSESDEVRFRARIVLKKLRAEGSPISASGKMARVVRVLERADTSEARDLLARMAEGEFGFDGAADARAALQRMPKEP